jgi:hypothetical protein
VNKKKRGRPRHTDLFDEIPVLWSECLDWCAVTVPHVSGQRLATYIRDWDVPTKVRAAKAAGTFAAVLDARAAQLHDRFQPRQPVFYADHPPQGNGLHAHDEHGQGDGQGRRDRHRAVGSRSATQAFKRGNCEKITAAITAPAITASASRDISGALGSHRAIYRAPASGRTTAPTPSAPAIPCTINCQ